MITNNPTPSKEAMAAALEITQRSNPTKSDFCGIISPPVIASIIDHHFAPLRAEVTGHRTQAKYLQAQLATTPPANGATPESDKMAFRTRWLNQTGDNIEGLAVPWFLSARLERELNQAKEHWRMSSVCRGMLDQLTVLECRLKENKKNHDELALSYRQQHISLSNDLTALREENARLEANDANHAVVLGSLREENSMLTDERETLRARVAELEISLQQQINLAVEYLGTVTELSEDKRRLDWLEPRYFYHSPNDYKKWEVEIFGKPGTQSVLRMDVRMAIDAALAATKSEGETKA